MKLKESFMDKGGRNSPPSKDAKPPQTPPPQGKVFADDPDCFIWNSSIELIEKEMEDFAYYARMNEDDIEARKAVVTVVIVAINRAGYGVYEREHVERIRADVIQKQNQLTDANKEIDNLKEQIEAWKAKHKKQMYAND